MSLKLRIKHFWNHFRLQLGFMLFAFYLYIGWLFLFTDEWIDFVPEYRSVIGGVLVLFGCLRFYQSYSRYKTKSEKLAILKQAKKTLEETQQHHQHAEVE